MGTIAVGTLFAGRHEHLKRLVEGVARSDEPPAELVIAAMGEAPPDLPDPGVPVTSISVSKPGADLPLSLARNEVARSAMTDHILMLDVDCIPSPGLVGSARRLLDDRDTVAMGSVRYLPPGRHAFDRLEDLGRRHEALPADPTPGSPLDPSLFWSLAFATRRRTWLERIDGFDEGYVGYGGEDTDFALRAERAGVELSWLGGPPAFHQHHPSLSPPANHLESIVRNARRFRSIWDRWPMEGWLREFEASGWVSWEPTGTVLELIRPPSRDELDALRRE